VKDRDGGDFQAEATGEEAPWPPWPLIYDIALPVVLFCLMNWWRAQHRRSYGVAWVGGGFRPKSQPIAQPQTARVRRMCEVEADYEAFSDLC
jgi:hypothetical protein